MRGNGSMLEKHSVGTFGVFIGRCLKLLFRVKGNERQVLEWLKDPGQGDRYRLFLFLSFIEEVSIIDVSMPFVSYKILLQSFQE